MDLDALLERIGGPMAIAIAIGVGLVILYVLSRVLQRPKASPHLDTRSCDRCGWVGSVSRFKPVCPKCGYALD